MLHRHESKRPDKVGLVPASGIGCNGDAVDVGGAVAGRATSQVVEDWQTEHQEEAEASKSLPRP
jgi:hypothetical protein